MYPNIEALRGSGNRLHAFLPDRMKRILATVVLSQYLTGLGSGVLVGGLYLYFNGGSTTQASAESIALVERQTLVTFIKAAGKVTFSSEQQMRFNQKGTVKKVLVRLGEKVKQGQIMAELDMSSVLSDIRQAQLSIAASALQLKQLQNNNQKTVLDAQNSLTVSQQKLPSDLDAAQRSVTEKETALKQSGLDLEKQRTIEMQSMANTTQGVVSDSEKLLDSYYSVLTRGLKSRPLLQQSGANDLTIDNMLFNDFNAAQRVEFDYLTAISADSKIGDTYGSSLATTRDAQVLLSALDDARILANAVYTLGEETYSLLQGAITDPHTFTSSDLDSLRSTVNANRATAADLISTVDTAKANLSAATSDGGIPSVTLKQKEDAVTTAQNSLKLAKENLRNLQTQTPGNLESLTQAVANVTTDHSVSVSLKQNDIAQKQASLQKIVKSMDDYRLVAPFDGVITHIDYKVGDNLLDTGDTEFLTIENPGNIVVTIPLDQVDVVRVKAGMSAAVTFDAIPGQQFQATINQIDSTPIQQSGVVSYNVSVQLPTPQGLTILSGMTATVQIETSKRENVLVVPNLALQVVGKVSSVKRVTGESVDVQTGMTNGQYTEILSGLQESDAIYSENIASKALSNSNANNSNQMLRGIGGLGGGAPPR